MGDRFTVAFKDKANSTPIWLYSHWGGADQYIHVAMAIEAAEPRWHDPSYATRIAISSIVGDSWSGSTGFGLNAGPTCSTMSDYSNSIVVIWEDKLVQIVDSQDPSISRYTATFAKWLDAHQREKITSWVSV